MDALNRIAHLHPEIGQGLPLKSHLQENLMAILDTSPVLSWEALVRGGLKPTT
jgi:hypothetical protein